MAKYILGSGIVGLLAKMILGDEWEIIPFRKSRFFSFKPPLCDNFIIRDDKIEHFVSKELNGALSYIYNCAYSVNGQLVRTYDKNLSEAWLSKMTQDPPLHTTFIMKDRMSFGVYDIKVNQLYEKLQEKFKPSGKEVTKIDDNAIYFSDGSSSAFDSLVNTIPLNAFLKLCNKQPTLTYNDNYIFHVFTKDLNFEGANQVWVVDNDIAFYKATMIAENRYVIYFNKLAANLSVGEYLMKYLPKFDIIDGTMIKESIPTGQKPDLTMMENNKIFSVGMFAEHDLSADLGSSIKRLLRISSLA